MADKTAFPLIIGNVLLCEDVRPESNGKHTLLGVYAGDLLVQEFIGQLRMALYLELTAKRIGEVSAHVELAFNEVVLAGAEATFYFKKVTDPAVLTFPMFPVPLSGPGTLSVDVICGGIRRRALGKPVRQVDIKVLFPNASPPPAARSRHGGRAKASKP